MGRNDEILGANLASGIPSGGVVIAISFNHSGHYA